MVKKRKNKSKLILYGILILFILVLGLLVLQFKIVNKFAKKTDKVVIEGECSLFMNNIVHKIKDDSGCKTICGYQCEIKDEKLKDHEFVKNENSCNECICYCR